MKYDVAVVGAGPAGAWTAYVLASRGARVILADPSHPREKPCGGGVTGRALALVQPSLALDRLPAVSIRTARFIDTATATTARVPLDGGTLTGALVVASRTEFDGLILAAATRAGAALVTSRVTNIEIEHGGFRLDTANGKAQRVGWVIGADGANSVVRRRLARPFRRDQLSIATGFFARGISSDEIVLELVGDPPGYIWSFPRPDHLAIGICSAADAGVTAGALRARVAEWIRVTGIASGAPLEPYSWPIPSLSPRDFGTLEVAGHGWLLVGDAAGPRGSDHSRRDFLCTAVRRIRGRDAGIRMLAAGALLSRSRAGADCFRPRAGGAHQGGILPAALYAPAHRRSRQEPPDPGGHGRPHRRQAELQGIEMAAGEDARGRSPVADDDGEALEPFLCRREYNQPWFCFSGGASLAAGPGSLTGRKTHDS